MSSTSLPYISLKTMPLEYVHLHDHMRLIFGCPSECLSLTSCGLRSNAKLSSSSPKSLEVIRCFPFNTVLHALETRGLKLKLQILNHLDIELVIDFTLGCAALIFALVKHLDIWSCPMHGFQGNGLKTSAQGFVPLRVWCYSDSGKWLSSDGVDIISIYNQYSVDAIMVLVVAL